MNKRDQVVLVDDHDKEIGLEEKLIAHQQGALHRAISIFVFNSRGETMLQQRAEIKYHSAGLWSNTCCSHPFEGETILEAAHRRLREEMGFDCDLEETFSFVYKADVGHDLIEHEFDHVVFGMYDGEPNLNKDEVQNWKWSDLTALNKDAKKNPGSYTAWLKILLDSALIKKADIFLKSKLSTNHGTS